METSSFWNNELRLKERKRQPENRKETHLPPVYVHTSARWLRWLLTGSTKASVNVLTRLSCLRAGEALSFLSKPWWERGRCLRLVGACVEVCLTAALATLLCQEAAQVGLKCPAGSQPCHQCFGDQYSDGQSEKGNLCCTPNWKRQVEE